MNREVTEGSFFNPLVRKTLFFFFFEKIWFENMIYRNSWSEKLSGNWNPENHKGVLQNLLEGKDQSLIAARTNFLTFCFIYAKVMS